MKTVFEITSQTELQIKQMSEVQFLKYKELLQDNNGHTAVILVEAVRQSNQSIIDCLCALHTMHMERGYMVPAEQVYRSYLASQLFTFKGE